MKLDTGPSPAEVNAKSLMGVMMLAAGKGSRIVLEPDGLDEAEALDPIAALMLITDSGEGP